MAGREYSNAKKDRKNYGGGKTHSGLFGMGASDKQLSEAKEKRRVRKESDATKKRMRKGNPDAPQFGPKQGKSRHE